MLSGNFRAIQKFFVSYDKKNYIIFVFDKNSRHAEILSNSKKNLGIRLKKKVILSSFEMIKKILDTRWKIPDKCQIKVSEHMLEISRHSLEICCYLEIFKHTL